MFIGVNLRLCLLPTRHHRRAIRRCPPLEFSIVGQINVNAENWGTDLDDIIVPRFFGAEAQPVLSIESCWFPTPWESGPVATCCYVFRVHDHPRFSGTKHARHRIQTTKSAGSLGLPLFFPNPCISYPCETTNLFMLIRVHSRLKKASSTSCDYCRVTTAVRHPTFPAASAARIVTVFDPTSNGTVALHCVVPVDVPAPPVLVVQVTDVTPTLSLAVPLKTIDAAEVETDVDAGDIMVNEGGVVFAEGAGDAGVGVGVGVGVGAGVGAGTGAGTGGDACVRVIAADCETSVTPSVAVTTTVFDPIVNGKFVMLHAPPATCPVPVVPTPDVP